eukprot:4699970-Amphidinium_carterae.1
MSKKRESHIQAELSSILTHTKLEHWDQSETITKRNASRLCVSNSCKQDCSEEQPYIKSSTNAEPISR